jgi:hypothetical protein
MIMTSSSTRVKPCFLANIVSSFASCNGRKRKCFSPKRLIRVTHPRGTSRTLRHRGPTSARCPKDGKRHNSITSFRRRKSDITRVVLTGLSGTVGTYPTALDNLNRGRNSAMASTPTVMPIATTIIGSSIAVSVLSLTVISSS